MRKSILIRDTEVTVPEILEKIYKGYRYEQILAHYPNLTMTDIMGAARFAHEVIAGYVTTDRKLVINGQIQLKAHNGQIKDITKIRETHPRAFQPWETRDDNELMALHRQGLKVDQIAEKLGRQRGAVIARLKHFGELGGKPPPPEPPEARG